MNKNAIGKFIVTNENQPLKGTTTVPGDKSLSHRIILMGMIAKGTSNVSNWLSAGDTRATLGAAQALGVQIDQHNDTTLTIHGGTLKPSSEPLDFVNAGTGIRLAAGIMAGQSFASVLDGSEQLRNRPMKRIIAPLQMMGAKIDGEDNYAPLNVEPASLKGMTYDMPVASGQVKSAVLLAGLFAEGETTVIEPGAARDHTERMLKAMGANITVDGNKITLKPNGSLNAINMNVPGDFSSAAFLIVAGLIVPDSDIIIQDVNLNPTRTGLLDVLLEMGADITITEKGEQAGEPVGDLHIKHSVLKGIEVGGDVVVRMIDEFPVFMVAALCAEGTTTARDAHELRVKETDRLAVMTAELTKMGAKITENDDGFVIEGGQSLTASEVEGHDDHRIAMALTVASLVAEGTSTINDSKCTADSFPNFADHLTRLQATIEEYLD